jgi:hypothetical protein
MVSINQYSSFEKYKIFQFFFLQNLLALFIFKDLDPGLTVLTLSDLLLIKPNKLASAFNNTLRQLGSLVFTSRGLFRLPKSELEGDVLKKNFFDGGRPASPFSLAKSLS